MSTVTLGYIEDPERPHLLHRRYFPSKVGGKPAWLDPVHLPHGEKVLQCTKPECLGQPLTFILQVYAGRDLPEDAFHRTVYIFGCQWCSETFVALRCQLPRENSYYAPVPADKKDPSIVDDCLEGRCCPACGIPTNKRVEPKVVEEGCEKLDGIPLIHRRCKVASEWVDQQIPVVFEEGKLDIDGENLDPSEVENADFSHEQALLERYKIEERENPDAVLDETEQDAFDDIQKERLQEDCVFSNFLERIRLNPGHVLRYYPEELENPTPLWFSSFELPTQQQLEEQVGRCFHCGGRRRLEFQIQPNLIMELTVACRFSFGILAVYTCARSCSPRPDSDCSYIQECVIRQPEKFR